MGERIKVGIDVDGVLADFITAFMVEANALFNIPVVSMFTDWNYGGTGITEAQADAVWEKLKNTSNWWLREVDMLPETDGLSELDKKALCYFITSRGPTVGDPVEKQTAQWLRANFGLFTPTVIVMDLPSQKVPLAKALTLDYFIDDKPSTCKQMANAGLKSYVKDALYNKDVNLPRVATFNDFVEEVLRGRGQLCPTLT